MVLTQEQKDAHRIRALERLKATKERLARERSGAAYSRPPDRPPNAMPTSHRDGGDLEPLPPVNEKFTNYIEYDLSKMKDTKGGYIADESAESSTSNKGLTLQEWQDKNKRLIGPVPFDHPDAPKCFECKSPELDFKLYDVFKCRVCSDCKEKFSEKYSLLTKTECKEDYLLTDPELRDAELLPHLEKPNPHSSTYNNMMLFLRYQVEEHAFKKWGGPEGLDAEYEKRVQDKKLRKEKKFLEKLRDMRRKTRAENITKRHNTKHDHQWIDMGTQEADGEKTLAKKCTICGMMKHELIF